MNRKKFLSRSLHTTAGLLFAPYILRSAAGRHASPSDHKAETAGEIAPPIVEFKQLPLPYAYDALEPSIDRQTMEIHYTKHHAKYVSEVRDAIAAEHIDAVTEVEFFANVSRYTPKARNNGGGAWNHNFFWQVMKPGAGDPPGQVTDALDAAFGSLDQFKEKFTEAGKTRFGSGWAWLVKNNGKLEVGSTPNQDNPLMDVSTLRGTPLLGLDVWEHAYYLKYQNKRDEYIANWWKVVNWDEVARRMA